MNIEQNFDLVTFTDDQGSFIADFRDAEQAAFVTRACTFYQDLLDSLSAMLLEHDAGGVTMATSREARALIAQITETE